jgi:hypothetical protein
MLRDNFRIRKKPPAPPNNVTSPIKPGTKQKAPPPEPPVVDEQAVSGRQNAQPTLAELMYHRLTEAEALGYTGNSSQEFTRTTTSMSNLILPAVVM